MNEIFAALDMTDLQTALNLSKQMSEIGCGVKLGMEFFYSNGPKGVETIKKEAPNAPIFLDLKSHDIPTTVMKAYKALAFLEVNYINLHALGSYEMMEQAADGMREECDKQNVEAPKILAVTILTSHNKESLQKIGLKDESIADHVKRLALLTQEAGLDGVVCSGHEIEILRENCGDDFVLMVPGIRPEGEESQDQKRTMTPLEAMRAGANHLVIGRPITGKPDPIAAAQRILESLKR